MTRGSAPGVTRGGRVTALRIYPLKAAAGIAVDEARVDTLGLQGDRRWMIVDADGNFVSQRTHPRMALVRTLRIDDGIAVSASSGATIRLHPPPPDARRTTLRVWFSDRDALDCGDAAAAWASDLLGTACRVVHAIDPERGLLLTDEGHPRSGFADAAPALVTNQASLADLNHRLDAPIGMDRFRPNIIVGGFGPWEEDEWGSRRIGEVPTRALKRCPRCTATRVDQTSGRISGAEPLATLATFRRNARGEVEFGMNIAFRDRGTIRVGDPIGGPDR
ncbi:MAG: MOSC domain-containing protein [Longimicrobiales bacterium]|nr:MOSC domain-containing protein [Longimicrobiales bacterium]